MRIAFFGSYCCFDYHHIGGLDSIARRLGVELVGRGEDVAFVHFNCPKETSEIVSERFTLRYFHSLSSALEHTAGKYDHVLNFHVPLRQRLTWMRFRRRESKRTRFHIMFTGWHENPVTRLRTFVEARIEPYNGTHFCISPRTYSFIAGWGKRAKLLLPPVPQNYFLTPEDKPKHQHPKITYMGRVDPGKGTPVAIDLFQYLARKDIEVESRICGYPWKHKPDTMRLYEKLLSQDEILYEPAEFEGYSQAVEDNVRKVLRETDILLLPYDKLSSTVDTPLLLLEGMANLCVIITRPLGNMPEIYGTDKFMLDNLGDYEKVEVLIEKVQRKLDAERERIFSRSSSLKFTTKDITDLFLSCI